MKGYNYGIARLSFLYVYYHIINLKNYVLYILLDNCADVMKSIGYFLVMIEHLLFQKLVPQPLTKA